jgi:hypothetical protein
VTADLARRYVDRFPERLEGTRTVGREAEFPLVTPDGRAGDAGTIWPFLVEAGCAPVHDHVPGGPPGAVVGVRGDGWECLTEVGRCTVEVIVGPRASLHELSVDLDRALALVVPAAHAAGLRLLGYGIQPRTPAASRLLAPKRRYPVLVRATGGRWLRWCVTASDQVHVAVTRDELIPLFNLMNGLAGPIIALTANSPVYRGRPGRFASGREGLMEDVTGEPYRHGALPRPFRDVEDWVRFVLGMRCLFLPDGRGGYLEPRRPLAQVLDDPPDLDAFLFHDHYVWPSARPRAKLGTLEIRPACQQPPTESWAAAALALGLAEGHRDAGGLLDEQLGPEPWPALVRFRRAAVRMGVRAPEPGVGLLQGLVDVARGALAGRGLGEDPLMAPIQDRLDRREGPSDRARRLAEDHGPAALVEELVLG